MYDTVLEIESLEKELKTEDARFLLSVPRFQLARGEVVGLSGKSGSGKSTFLDMLALISIPTRAALMRLSVDSRQHDLAPTTGGSLPEGLFARLRSLHFGYVLQSGGLLGYLTVGDNAALPWILSGRAPDRARIATVAERLGLETLLSRYPRSLSGGQRQRASVLRALAPQPAVVLCDEPTASVDALTAEAILFELRSLARESGSATVLVSHDYDMLTKFSDRICQLRAESDGPGRIRSVLQENAAA
jgi:putative ABC transport system ATP-binding protein